MEWKEVRIKDTLSCIIDNRGKTPKEISDCGHPLLEVNCISKDFKYPLYDSVRKYVGDKIYNTWFRSGHPQKGDILIPTVGSLGAVSLVNRNDCCIAQNIIAIRTDNSFCHNDFLYYLLNDTNVRKRLLNLDIGGVQPSIKVPHLMNLEISLPPITLQRKIANILSSLDAKIENNNKINANLEAQAAALFKSWFVDFEPFKDGEFVESELGMIPKGWKVGTLSDIAIINPSLKLSKGTEATYLDMKNMPTSGSFPSAWEKKLYNGGMKFSYGDTLMARITPCLENGKVAYANFLQEDEVAFGSTEYIVLRPQNGILPEVFYFLCRYPDFIGYATKNMNGSSGRQRVSGETIGNYKIVIPPIDKIKPLIGYFKSVMDEVRNNGFENQRLASLRDTLLPKLMSGEIELLNLMP